uniref:Nucleotid_trans domain-containing protein n=1 Tax=Caenorhabditis tropicalis TaxID=1561998 RepID=A0A1I7TGF2_9PELO
MFHSRRFVGYLIILICLLSAFIFFTDIPDDSENLYHIPYPIIIKSENPVNVSAEDIALVIVLSEGVGRDFYRISIDSVECYATTRGYKFILTTDRYWGCDYLKDMFLAEKLFPNDHLELELCRKAWKNSQNVADQFAYTSCIRQLFGSPSDFGKVRILRKGTGHVRDDWLTSGIWSPERDFMLHGWKMNQLKETPRRPLEAVAMDQDIWYNPFRGEFDLDKCSFGNTTWNHDPRLIGTRGEVEYALRKYEMRVGMKRIKYLGRLFDLIRNNCEDILDDSEHLFHISYHPIKGSDSPLNISSERIAIVIVLAEGVERKFYEIAIDSVECYSKAHGYQFILTNDRNWGCDHLNDKFFRRHCVISKILPKYEAVLHLDADIGVVNPKRKLEEFLDPNFDIIFHDRHFSPEIGMASYLIRNTGYSRTLIKEFSEYEKHLPDGSFHGTDNGAIHMFLAEKLFPKNPIDLELCRRAWRNSRNVADQFAYTTCIRAMFGATTDFGTIRILKKGTGYVRDDWLTSGIWSPERDFMLHGWKMNQLKATPREAFEAEPMKQTVWYSPFQGGFDLDRCTFG